MESSLYSAEETALLGRFFGDDRADPASHIASRNVAPDGALPERFADAHAGSAAFALWAGVAGLVLENIQRRLPCWIGLRRSGDEWVYGREFSAPPARPVSIAPVSLFQMVWAYSAPGIEWPEAYCVSYVPGFDRYVVTASADSPDAWGHTDLAIGWFTADKDVLESSGDIIRQWWQSQRDGWDQEPWVEFRRQGAVSEDLATAWRAEVWFPPSDDDPDEEESDSVTVQENSYDR